MFARDALDNDGALCRGSRGAIPDTSRAGITRGGGVTTLVESGEPTDDALRRAIEQATARAENVAVIQLINDLAAIRRALDKEVLARDVTWWCQSPAGIAEAIEGSDDSSFEEAAALLQVAACILVSTRSSWPAGGMSVPRRRVRVR